MSQEILTQEQKTHYQSLMVPANQGTPVRFMRDGRATNPITGHQDKKGINVLYQTVYWNFKKETAREIAEIIGARCVFSI